MLLNHRYEHGRPIAKVCAPSSKVGIAETDRSLVDVTNVSGDISFYSGGGPPPPPGKFAEECFNSRTNFTASRVISLMNYPVTVGGDSRLGNRCNALAVENASLYRVRKHETPQFRRGEEMHMLEKGVSRAASDPRAS